MTYDDRKADTNNDLGSAPDGPEETRPTSGGGRPASYKALDGKRVPGVTTITSRFKESGALIHWAWALGRDGQDYRKVRDAAADAGHVAHEMIDASIHGRPAELPDLPAGILELARAGFEAFRTWRTQVELQVLSTETPLVSEAFRFGGTYDALGLVSRKRMLLDWKSGNRVYPEHVIQCAAYRQLLREHEVDIDEACLLRVGKEMGDFHYSYFPKAVLDVGWLAFQQMRSLYDLDAKLKKVVG